MFCRNIKTGKVYSVISFDVINSTNGIAGSLVMVLYKDNKGQYFVREGEEFHNKFVEVTGTNTGPSEMEEIVLGFMDNIKPKDTRAKEPTLQGKLEDLNIAFNHLKAEVDKRFEAVFNTIGSWKMVIEKEEPVPKGVNWYQDIWKKGTSVYSFCDCGTEPNGTELNGRCGVCGNKLNPSLFRSSNDLQFKAEYFNSPMVEDNKEPTLRMPKEYFKFSNGSEITGNGDPIESGRSVEDTFNIEDILTEKHGCKVCGRTFTDSVELYYHYDLAHNKGLEE